MKTKGNGKQKKLRFGTDWLMNNISFIVVVAVLGLVMIFNTNRAERKLVKIHGAKSELRDLMFQYSTLKKDLKSRTVLSKLEKDLEGKVVFPKKGPVIIGPDKS